MIRSMTGYGKGSSETPRLRVTVELRSLNNRYADLRLRVPPELYPDEGEIRRLLLSRLRRGRVEMNLDLQRGFEGEPGVSLNRPFLQALAGAARQARDEFGFTGELNLGTVFSIPESLQRAPTVREVDESEKQAVLAAIGAAVEALETERLREGSVLRVEILERLARLEEISAEIRVHASRVPEGVRRKLLDRLQELTSGSVPIDPVRLAQEAAFLADRSDVTEELVRLEGHISQARVLVADTGDEPVGKKLDFLLQEIHRETNTINSKSSNLEVSRCALALKSEAEKFREQIQNVE